VTTLAEELGFGPRTRLAIINADDLGLCHSANVGVFGCLRTGVVTSASLMVPGPWGREAVARYRGEDVGVHLTVNAEHERYRWGPITHAPSLLGGDGGFPRTRQDVWDHADLDEVRRECRAQIERAILWGFDVSHLDTHMGTLEMRPEFFDVYLDLAVEFRLPVRIFGGDVERRIGFPARDLAREAGVVFADHVVHHVLHTRAELTSRLSELPAGVTVVHIRPAVDSAELRSLAADWKERVEDHAMVCDDDRLRKALDEAGVVLVGYRTLRQLARERR
jgi:predicted glycoside hydrolase/deacetylase ChbG (UPF0249 family)